jgi:RNA polymerase sigma factor (sigma-70 family)
METTDLITRASAGDHDAFRELIEVHSRELQVHCYRILGSLQDAEDALQETLVSAWRNLGDFGQRSSLRTWLYQIATNRCLSMLRADSRRPRTASHPRDLTLPEPTGTSEVPPWLEPYPDVLLDSLVDQAPGPEARYETTEAISLAFITALQLLPPRQRAVLVLRDVLGYRATEVAEMLGTTQESVQSALKRARATVDGRLAGSGGGTPSRQPDTAAEQRLAAQRTGRRPVPGGAAHRGRPGLDAAGDAGVRGNRRGTPLLLGVHLPAGPVVPGGSDSRERPASVRRVHGRSAYRRLPRVRTIRRHGRRRPHRGAHRFRHERDATVRATQDAPRSGLTAAGQTWLSLTLASRAGSWPSGQHLKKPTASRKQASSSPAVAAGRRACRAGRERGVREAREDFQETRRVGS